FRSDRSGHRFTQIFTDNRPNFAESLFYLCSSGGEMIEKFLLAFIPVFVAIFMGLGTSASSEHRKRQAFLGLFTGLLVSIGFIFLGKIIFKALGITVADFQVAGGLILLALAV